MPASTLTFSLAGATGGRQHHHRRRLHLDADRGAGTGELHLHGQVCERRRAVLRDAETITVTVSEVNVAPVLGPIGDQSVAEEMLLSFTATATDPDIPAQTLTFSLAGAPAGAGITTGGVFTWTPTEAQGPGSYTFDVCVSDGALSDCETITVTVSEVNVAAGAGPDRRPDR